MKISKGISGRKKNNIDLGPFQENSLYCGDCAKLMAQLPENCVKLGISSPPYDLVDQSLVTHSNKGLRDYTGYDWNFVAVADQLYRIIEPGGVMVWIVGDQTIKGNETGSSFRQALYFQKIGFSLADTMIYQVLGTGAKGSRKTYWQTFEFMFILSKGAIATSNLIKDVKNLRAGTVATKGRRQKNGQVRDTKTRSIPKYSVRGNIWTYHVGNSGNDKNSHPAVFPEALARDHIISWSNPGDLVFDPFIGSGTVAKMAIETGRKFLGFDISQKYIDMARCRIKGARIPLFQI